MPEPLLLIPGLMCNAALFQPQVKALASERQVMVADHTGSDQMAGIARQILDSAPQRFALAGLSMGVYLSLEIVALAPHRVSRLALLDGKAEPDTAEQTAARRALIKMADDGRFMEITSQVLLPRLVAQSRMDDVALCEVVLNMARETGEAVFRRQMAAIMGRRDYRPELLRIDCPTLVLCGALDIITPSTCSVAMAQAIRGSKLAVLAGTGHLSTLEAPAEVSSAMHDWLEM